MLLLVPVPELLELVRTSTLKTALAHLRAKASTQPKQPVVNPTAENHCQVMELTLQRPPVVNPTAETLLWLVEKGVPKERLLATGFWDRKPIADNGTDPDRGTEQQVVFAQIDLDKAPADTADAYLRLHLLSHRLAAPNSLDLDGVFGLLANVVWTSAGPASPAASGASASDRTRSS